MVQLDDWIKSTWILEFLVGAKIWVLPQNFDAPLGGKYVSLGNAFSATVCCILCVGVAGWFYVGVYFDLYTW